MVTDIFQRFVKYASGIYNISSKMESTFENDILRKQLFRSGSSASLNYAESIGSESRKDFIHKTSIVLKELRESHMNLLIIEEIKILKNAELLTQMIDETNQLISILVKSINTAKKNLNK